MTPKTEDSIEAKFEVVKEYINTGSSTALPVETQRVLDICLDTYGIIRKYPQRNICIKRLMHIRSLSYPTAAKYVDFVRSQFGNFVDIRREFLEAFFLDRLLSDISNPNASEGVRAKNLATLQRHIEHMPDNTLDPHLTEQNNVYIQFNIAGRELRLPEAVINALPVEIRQSILGSVDDTLDEGGAVAMLES